MSAISGTRRAIKELADGTIRVQIDIDPQFRTQFFSLFPNIDTPVAIAPLAVGRAPMAAMPASEEAPKGGPLARLAGQLCSSLTFRLWFWEQEWEGVNPVLMDEEDTARCLREVCGIRSRAELDHNAAAAEIFHEKIRKPWLAYSGQ